jgi:probable rRNA maturation factor
MSIRLDWNNELSESEISDSLIKKLEELLETAAAMENVRTGVVSLSFVDDETIHQLNQQYRGIDRPTDVLSFAMEESIEDEMVIQIDEEDQDGPSLEHLLGDIIISVPTAKAQSKEYGHSPEREIGFLFVHGFLHLLGYDHQDGVSEESMFAKQEEILQKVGLIR